MSRWLSACFPTLSITTSSQSPSTNSPSKRRYDSLSSEYDDDSEYTAYSPSYASETERGECQSGATRANLKATFSRFGKSVWESFRQTAHRVMNPDFGELDAELRAYDTALQRYQAAEGECSSRVSVDAGYSDYIRKAANEIG